MTRATPVLALTLLASLLSAPVALANHDQGNVRFDSLGGNEWWVEVKLSGAKASSRCGAPRCATRTASGAP